MPQYIDAICGQIEITVNVSNGHVSRIVDKRTKLVHFDTIGRESSDEFLFRLIIPVEEWSSHFADSRDTKPVITKRGERLLLSYSNLKAANGKKTGITVSVEISSSHDSGELYFEITVENKGHYIINEVCFPALNGWRGEGENLMVIGAYHSLNPHSLPSKGGFPYLRLRHRRFYAYPANMFAPWFDISGKKGGISCINYMENPRNCGVYVENMEGYTRGYSLSCGWAHWPLIKPGQVWSSPAIALSCHNSNWHATADRYTRWVETWFKPPPTPLSARLAVGTQNVFLRGFDGTPFHKLDSIPEIARTGRQYGVNHLCIWDYATLGNYSRHGDVELMDYTDKKKDILRKGLLRAREEGTNVSALINFRIINHNNKLFGKRFLEDALKNYDGTLKMEAYAGEHCTALGTRYFMGPVSYLTNLQAESHRRRILELCRKYMHLGYNSMFYDQPFEYYPNYNLKKPSDKPDCVYESIVTLLADIRRMLHENDTESFMTGEQCDVFAAQYIDMWMSWFPSFHMAQYAAYSVPMTIMSWVTDSDKGTANRAFASGMHLCLCTHGIEKTLDAEPEFAGHIKKLARLRRTTAQRTVLGRFRDTCGVEILKGEELAIQRFESARGPAVIISDYTGKGGVAHVRVAIDDYSGKNGIIFRLDGRRMDTSKKDELKVQLNQYEAIVWYI